MSRKRDAVDTIKGYYYQFNYSIQCILNGNDDDEFTVEGIEDVDAASGDETLAIQCKYYSKSEYNHSVIAKPVRFMFKDYMERTVTGDYISYKLYGTYKSGQSKLTLPLTAQFLKEKFFSFTENKVKHELHTELDASDAQIEDFISKLTININAESYESLEKSVIDKLTFMFHCRKAETEFFYYNNALRIVKELATSENVTERRISKRDFIARIDNKKMLFDSWYLQFRGINEVCKRVKSEYFTKYNVTPIERYFLIECDELIDDSDIVKMVGKISKNWSKLSSKEPKPFCPYVLLYSISDERLISIKKKMINQGLVLCDGYDFLGADFNPESINRVPDYRNGIKIKMVNELAFVETILNIQRRTKEIYQFYLTEPFFETDKGILFNIQIPSTECVAKMI